MNGLEIPTSGRNAPLAGGTLAAAFDVRDGLAVEAQTRLDAVARDFVERFQDPSVDTTLGLGDAGLFTDDGAAFDPSNETGLSGRIEVNALVVPASGGALWRLRDGLGAAAEGPVGENALLGAGCGGRARRPQNARVREYLDRSGYGAPRFRRPSLDGLCRSAERRSAPWLLCRAAGEPEIDRIAERRRYRPGNAEASPDRAGLCCHLPGW